MTYKRELPRAVIWCSLRNMHKFILTMGLNSMKPWGYDSVEFNFTSKAFKAIIIVEYFMHELHNA